MSKTLEFEWKGENQKLIKKSRELAESRGITTCGDEYAGTASGHGFAGSYRFIDNELSITITRKPLLLSWGMIEKAIAKFLREMELSDS